jgi:hypothetical protein
MAALGRGCGKTRIYAIWHDGYGVGLPPTPRSAPTASSTASRNCCSGRAARGASRTTALLWLFAATAANGQTSPGATYDPAYVVQAICRQYAAAQMGLPVDTMYAQCMYARCYRVLGSPPVRVLERLQEMFSELAFCCDWFAEDEFFYRHHPGQAAAIARREREQSCEHSIATLYLTNVDNPEFFLETRIIAQSRGSSKTEPMNRGEAHEWILAPDVKLLALVYPELPTAQTEAVGAKKALTRTSDKPIAEPDDQHCPDDIPF